MKLQLLVFAGAALFSATVPAATLACGSSQQITGEIYQSSQCDSGFGIKVGGNKTCVLASSSTRIFTGLVRGCGYDNGSGFVITDSLPLGAE